jgi:hypothetical protein
MHGSRKGLGPDLTDVKSVVTSKLTPAKRLNLRSQFSITYKLRGEPERSIAPVATHFNAEGLGIEAGSSTLYKQMGNV